jgi:hypothetical protein
MRIKWHLNMIHCDETYSTIISNWSKYCNIDSYLTEHTDIWDCIEAITTWNANLKDHTMMVIWTKYEFKTKVREPDLLIMVYKILKVCQNVRKTEWMALPQWVTAHLYYVKGVHAPEWCSKQYDTYLCPNFILLTANTYFVTKTMGNKRHILFLYKCSVLGIHIDYSTNLSIYEIGDKKNNTIT